MTKLAATLALLFALPAAAQPDIDIVFFSKFAQSMRILGFSDMRHGSLQRSENTMLWVEKMVGYCDRANVVYPAWQESKINAFGLWATAEEIAGRYPLIGWEPDTLMGIPIGAASWDMRWPEHVVVYWKDVK